MLAARVCIRCFRMGHAAARAAPPQRGAGAEGCQRACGACEGLSQALSPITCCALTAGQPSPAASPCLLHLRPAEAARLQPHRLPQNAIRARELGLRGPAASLLHAHLATGVWRQPGGGTQHEGARLRRASQLAPTLQGMMAGFMLFSIFIMPKLKVDPEVRCAAAAASAEQYCVFEPVQVNP